MARSGRSISLDRNYYRRNRQSRSGERDIDSRRRYRSYSRDSRRRTKKARGRSDSRDRDSHRLHKKRRSIGRKGSYSRSRSRSRSSRRSGSSDYSGSEEGHFEGNKGAFITNRYEIISELGKGTFGKVYKCLDTKHQDYVALKVVRSIKRYIHSAKIEAKLCDDVYKKQKEAKSSYCVKMFAHFAFLDHYVLVFETLGLSVYDLVKMNAYTCLPYAYVQSITQQLFHALVFLESMRLVHTDLKLENILFVHNTLQDMEVWHRGKLKKIKVPANSRIKLIDFGGATYIDDNNKSTVINTRQYRGPEVLLELDWDYKSDIWGAACIVGEVYDGELFFPAHEELEHFALIEKVCGHFPPHMLDKCEFTREYFDRKGRVRVKELSRDSTRLLEDTPSIETFFAPHHAQATKTPFHEELCDFMHKVLSIDPASRLSAQQALDHPFFQTTPPDVKSPSLRVRDKKRDKNDNKLKNFTF
eukprot:gene25628-30950_t